MPAAGVPASGRPSAARRPRYVAVAAALGLAGAALVAFAGQVLQTPAAAALAPLASLGPASLGRLANLTVDRQGRPPAGTEALARAALVAAPLADEPFHAAALTRFTVGARDQRDVEVLLGEAIRRNPRSRKARILLMMVAVDRGRLGLAIDQLAVLYRLSSPVAGTLMTALGRSITSERQIDEAVAGFNRHPELYKPLLRSLRQASRPPNLTARLITQMPASAMADPEVAELAVDELVRSQAFGEARRLWRIRSGAPAGELIHSPTFADSRSPPPFGWQLQATSVGAADRNAGGGLSLSYYGRQAGPLASQLLTLAPGSYEAVVRYRTEGGSPGAIGVALRCASNNDQVLAAAPLNGATGAGKVLRLPFRVPAGTCSGQFISVEGLPTLERTPQDALLQRIDIRVRGPA